MHRQQLDSAREGAKKLGTPIGSFRTVVHQWRAQGAHRSGMTSANDIYAAASIAAAETTKITAMSTAAHM